MNRNGNEIIITDEESRICLIDGKKFESNRKMIWHVRKIHHLNFEKYILKVFYNNIAPVCLKTGVILKFKATGCLLGRSLKDHAHFQAEKFGLATTFKQSSRPRNLVCNNLLTPK